MALTSEQRDQVWRAYMRIIDAEPCPFTKAVLRTAVDNADDWADVNAASFNTALNTAFRTNATATQKAALLALVCWVRAGRPLAEGL